MAAVAGYAGQVRVSTNVVADVQKWNGDIDMNLADVTALAAAGGAKAFLPTLLGGKVTIEANFNYGDTLGQKALHDAFFARTTVTVNLDTAASGTGRTYTGTVYVGKISPAVEVAGVVKIKFEAQFTGAITFA